MKDKDIKKKFYGILRIDRNLIRATTGQMDVLCEKSARDPLVKSTTADACITKQGQAAVMLSLMYAIHFIPGV